MNLESEKLVATVKEIISRGEIDRTIQLLVANKNEINENEILTISSRYNIWKENENRNIKDENCQKTELAKITATILKIIERYSKNQSKEKNAKIIHSNYVYSFNKEGNWERTKVIKKDTNYQKKFQKNKTFNLIGLPKTGRTTKVKKILQDEAVNNHTIPIYIDCNFKAIDYNQLLNNLPLSIDSNAKMLIALDDYNDEVPPKITNNEINTSIIAIPSKILNYKHDIYEKEGKGFIQPLSKEISLISLNNLQQKENKFIPQYIIDSIIEYSAGIPSMIERLFYFFIENKKIPNWRKPENWLQRLDIVNEFKTKVNYVLSSDPKVVMLFLSLFSSKKSVDKFFRNLQIPLSRDAIFLKNIGIDNLTSSALLRNLFLQEYSLDFNKAKLNEFAFQHLKIVETDKIIWTPNFDLKIVPKECNLYDYVFKLLKSDTNFLSRVEWNNVKVNNKIKPLHYILKTGDSVSFKFGRRKEVNESEHDIEWYNKINSYRSKRYKKRKKKQRLLVREGDKHSKDYEYEKAEQKYISAIQIRTDSNWARVRLANLYRNLGKFDEAITICERIVRSTPNPYAYLSLGISLFWKGLFDDAYDCFLNAIKNRKTIYINGCLWMARCLLHLHKSNEASFYLDKIRTLRRNKNSTKPPSFTEKVLNWIVLYNEGYLNNFELKKSNLLKIANNNIGHSFKKEKNNVFEYSLSILIREAYSDKISGKYITKLGDATMKTPTLINDSYFWICILPDVIEEEIYEYLPVLKGFLAQ